MEMGSPEKVATSSASKTDLRDDRAEENGVFFWINKTGFPMDETTWDRMWAHVEKIHPDGAQIASNIKSRHLKHVSGQKLFLFFVFSSFKAFIRELINYFRFLHLVEFSEKLVQRIASIYTKFVTSDETGNFKTACHLSDN